MQDDFGDFPCGANCLPECAIKKKVTELQRSFIDIEYDASYQLVVQFLDTYKVLLAEASDKFPPDIVFPALFDFVASAKYCERVSNGGWIYCRGHVGEQPYQYFPFLKTCPRCSVKRGIKPRAKSNKPGSDSIGEIAADVTFMLMQQIAKINAPYVKLAKSSNRQGDVDMALYASGFVTYLEIKSSPLVVYPLGIRLSEILTEIKDGERSPMRDHSTVDVTNLQAQEIFMYLPHRDVFIDLGSFGSEDWPYQALTRWVRDPNNVELIIDAWRDLYEVYLNKRDRKRGSYDNRRWLTCGCGGTVDDSKNAPGLDRSDDIKKGTYQALKLGAYYKDKCLREIVSVGIASNFMPVHGYDQYLREIEDVVWSKSEHVVPIDEGYHDVIAFRPGGIHNLYDALICLTRSIFHSQNLYEIFSYEKFLERYTNG